jgi:hypothetical protein
LAPAAPDRIAAARSLDKQFTALQAEGKVVE